MAEVAVARIEAESWRRLHQPESVVGRGRPAIRVDSDIREETYEAVLATLTDNIHAQPMGRLWGDGDTSSSDGQFSRAGSHGEGRADVNARYGRDPGVKFYTHMSDRYAPFHTKVIVASVSEAAYVLDGLLQHESSLSIREHYTDTAGGVDYVFGLCHLLGFRFLPRARRSGRSCSPAQHAIVPPARGIKRNLDILQGTVCLGVRFITDSAMTPTRGQ